VAGRRSPVTDIREILRRLHLGEPDRRIARDLGISRNTVAHYRVWAARHGVLDGGALPDVATLAELLAPAPSERPAHEQSLVEPLRERVLALHERGVEGQAIWQLLVEEHGFTGSYSSVKRFLRRLAPSRSRATLRLEVGPGEEAQVDFGYAGQFLDPEHGRGRRAWVFVMTLSCSRHQYAELVFELLGREFYCASRSLTLDTPVSVQVIPPRGVLISRRAALRDGQKVILAVESGYRESTESWAAILRDLTRRGLAAPKVVIGDGHLGIWGALAAVFPEAKEQRCWNHRLLNVLDKLPLTRRSPLKRPRPCRRKSCTWTTGVRRGACPKEVRAGHDFRRVANAGWCLPTS